MAERKLTPNNMNNILQDWLTNATNRGDTLHFILKDIDEVTVTRNAFERGMKISVKPTDDTFGAITFVTLLT